MKNCRKELDFFNATVFADKLEDAEVVWKYKGKYYREPPFPGLQSFGDVAGIRDNYTRLARIDSSSEKLIYYSVDDVSYVYNTKTKTNTVIVPAK